MSHVRAIGLANNVPAVSKTKAVVTCETKLFQNYSSLRIRPIEIILLQRSETCLKLF